MGRGGDGERATAFSWAIGITTGVGVGSDMDLIGNPNPVNGPPMTETPNWERFQLHRDPEGRITVAGLDHPKRTFDLTEGLIRRRYSDADIKLILGGNFARVLGKVWSGVGKG